jgi:uncharacterized protein (DUF302 family)
MTYYQAGILKSTDIADLPGKIEAGLKETGFGILSEIDLQATMKKEVGQGLPAFPGFESLLSPD